MPAQVIGAVMAGCILRKFELGSKGNLFLEPIFLWLSNLKS